MERIAELLANVGGFNAASARNAAVTHAVHGRMGALGIADAAAYADVLERNPEEMQRFVEMVIVPETWFFRNPEALAALADLVATEWVARHPGNRLRVLSAPCSTGEEPYSIAITLAELGLAQTRVEIDAIDISRSSIARAQRGVYGANSFRERAASERKRYWQSRDDGFELSPDIRAWVRFAHGNIASATFAPPSKSYDVIFCRNVLIYFDRDVQARVIDRLRGMLEPDGYLFVGPAEALLATERGFTSTGHPMSFAFRKSVRAASSATKPVDPRTLRAPRPSAPPPVPERRGTPRAAVRAGVVPGPATVRAPIRAPDVLESARALADAGRLAEAVIICERYVDTQRLSPAGWYLLGLIRDAMGETSLAIDCYRRVVFLDPAHEDAAAHLRLLGPRRSDAERAGLAP